MANFKADILQAMEPDDSPENIEAIVIKSNIDIYLDETDSRNSDLKTDTVYQWKDVAEKFDYAYDAGYGSKMDCHDIIIWTPKYIYYVHEYDGSTWIESLMRNPPEIKNAN